jgi:hypothetical protein
MDADLLSAFFLDITKAPYDHWSPSSILENNHMHPIDYYKKNEIHNTDKSNLLLSLILCCLVNYVLIGSLSNLFSHRHLPFSLTIKLLQHIQHRWITVVWKIHDILFNAKEGLKFGNHINRKQPLQAKPSLQGHDPSELLVFEAPLEPQEPATMREHFKLMWSK